jgi:hypothetical protein
MSLVYPAKPKPNEVIPPAKVNNGITFLISEDKIYYYQGQFYTPGNPDGKPATELKETNFGPTGLRKLLADLNSTVLKNKEGLDKQLKSKQIQDTTYERMLNEFKGSKEALKVLIKTDDKATCKNFIDLVDELKIAQIGVIAPVDLLKSEQDLMKAKQ